MSNNVVIYEDTDKRIERDENGEDHTIWTNPNAVEAQLADIQLRLAALEALAGN
jgi:hypothetical protein